MCETHKKTVAFNTFGCKLNQAETEMMREAFEARGFTVIKFNSAADVYVVNTCTVTGKTDHQCRQALRHALLQKQHNPSTKVIATGCYAQTNPRGLLTMVDGIDLVAGNIEKNKLADLALELFHEPAAPDAARICVSDIKLARTLEPPRISQFTGLTRAFLRVQDGCNNRCAYCIIPHARGPSRSMSPDMALDQARAFAESGHRELVITGIHVGRYGIDLTPKTSLAALLRSLHRIPGVESIRLSSIEPGEVSEELLDTLGALPGMCPHFHISLQSGDADILRAMRRNYSPGDFAAVARAIRSRMPDACIGADIITGFPGETDQAFENTCGFIKDMELAYLHIFRYSQRPGTPAADMPGQVQEEIKKERSAALHAIRGQLNETYRKRFVGRTMDVLFEHRRLGRDALLTGLTGNYLRVSAKGPDSLMGCITPVRLTALTKAGVTGEIEKQQ